MPVSVAKCKRKSANIESMSPKKRWRDLCAKLRKGLEPVCAARPVAKRIAAAIDTKYVLFM